MSLISLPVDYPRIRCVASFAELVETPWGDGVNALCWPRTLPGDFAELAFHLSKGAAPAASGAQPLALSRLSQYRLSPNAALALAAIAEDLDRLQERGLEPELNWIIDYPRDDAAALVATDVYSFHVDRAPVEVDTWLCTYYGEPSQGLRNDEALARVQQPTTRRALLEQFGGVEGAAFEQFLRDNNYDLHYSPQADASPWSFGQGCLWRVAVTWPGSLVPPCIHRAPSENPRGGTFVTDQLAFEPRSQRGRTPAVDNAVFARLGLRHG